ncbi:hypothetical protein TNCV_3233051 [Trichonephila clavipes]|nr:hypothetical protein TNCV_3233051 [Trichonephila clavipes]
MDCLQCLILTIRYALEVFKFTGKLVAFAITHPSAASDSRPEYLGSMLDATKYPPSTHGVRARKISGSESLVGGRSRIHGCKGMENISHPSSSLPKLWMWR